MAIKTEFNLFKNNLIQQKTCINIQDAAEKFKSTMYHDFWKMGSPLERQLLAFISAPEYEGGLSGTFDSGEWIDIYDSFYAILKKEHIEKMNVMRKELRNEN